MSKKDWMLISGAFASMNFLGMSRTFLGTALPAIRSSLNLDLIQAGNLLALLQLGFATTVFVGGPVSDFFRKSSILFIGCLLMGINLIIFGFSSWFWVSIVAISFIGIGGGLIESSSNPLLIEFFPGKESMVMNLHHFFFATGSLAGPLIIGVIFNKSVSWQWAYIGFGFFVMVSLILFSSHRRFSTRTNSRFEIKAITKLINQKTFLIIFFLAFFSNGVQNGIGYWTVTFLMESKEVTITVASLSLSLFFLGIAIGRLLLYSSHFIKRFSDTTYLLYLFLFVIITILISTFSFGKWMILFFGLSGLACSGVFPCLLGMAGSLFPSKPGTAMGIVATGAGLGAMFIPWLVSLISQLTNITTGFFSLEFFALICFILLAVNFQILKSPATQTVS